MALIELIWSVSIVDFILSTRNPRVLTASCRAGSSSTPASPRLEIFNYELKSANSSQDQTLQTSKTVLMGPICLWLKAAPAARAADADRSTRSRRYSRSSCEDTLWTSHLP